MEQEKSYLQMANYEHKIRVCFLELRYITINVHCSVSMDITRDYTCEEKDNITRSTINELYRPLSADILRRISGQSVLNVLSFFLREDSNLYVAKFTLEDGKYCFTFTKTQNNTLSINPAFVSDIKIEE